MPEMFTAVQPLEGYEIGTTTTATTTEEMPLQYDVDEDRGPTIDKPAPEATTSMATIAGMVYVSTTSI